MAGHARRNPIFDVHRLGGVVTLTPIRDRTGEERESYSVSWHSPSGDLRWLSPRIPSQESADVAAQILSDFTGATKR
jgi:hypothetical protein